jgi:hypothetical protein
MSAKRKGQSSEPTGPEQSYIFAPLEACFSRLCTKKQNDVLKIEAG